MIKPVFLSTFFEKRKTIETLLEESRVDADYYLFLLFSTFITAQGLLFGNAVVIIAGMLITPILYPILSLGMGFATVSSQAIRRAFGILLKSVALIVVVSLVIAFLSNQNEITPQLDLVAHPDIWLFLTAFFSGIVAAYTWVKQNESVALPSVALAVSTIVPLSAVGVAIGMEPFSREIFSGSLMMFVVNILGITLASMIVFLLFGFSNLQKWQDKKIKDEKIEIETTKAEAEAEKAKEIL